jgi:L-threonylcarbamoyladenylate synthase
MKTSILKIDNGFIPEQLIDQVVETLCQGGIIGYPTETIYGLGGEAENEKVIDKIRQLKGREINKPFLMLINRIQDLDSIVKFISVEAKKLIEQFWPGPLTLVFKAGDNLSKQLVDKEGRVGMRISSHPFCSRLLEKYNKPLISTSANPSSKAPASSAFEVLNYFRDKIDLIIDGGEQEQERPSTVMDVSVKPPKLLRNGIISIDEIQKIVGVIHV